MIFRHVLKGASKNPTIDWQCLCSCHVNAGKVAVPKDADFGPRLSLPGYIAVENSRALLDPGDEVRDPALDCRFIDLQRKRTLL
jgi:hypothetical protein